MLDRRASGILLHITSLPSLFGIGDLGPEAYRFADFLSDARQRYWQVLPLTPTDAGGMYSPYSSTSVFALNPLLLSPEKLVEDGFILPSDISDIPNFSCDYADYERTYPFKRALLDTARRNAGRASGEYASYCRENSWWLDDYALFAALRHDFEGAPWTKWPPSIRDRNPAKMESVSQRLGGEIELEKFSQFIVDRQWRDLKSHLAGRGISVIGDIPIYASHDSADVWKNRDVFDLHEDGEPRFVAGVPPDYFSETGQLWGNPVYRWEWLKNNGFAWWMERFRRNADLLDIVRLDHFRGFVGYWEIPAGSPNAVGGRWVSAPAPDFFEKVTASFPGLSIIAEDLGVITDDVREAMSRFGFAGIRPVIFGFCGDMEKNTNAPFNLVKRCVVYTGTHDTNTVRGWFESDATAEEKQRLESFLGRPVDGASASSDIVEIVMRSIADTAIIPIQDILSLPGDARMNVPSIAHGNWRWRLSKGQITELITKQLRELTESSGRA